MLGKQEISKGHRHWGEQEEDGWKQNLYILALVAFIA